MNKFGEINWSDDVFGNSDKKKAEQKDMWMRLEDGTNELRVVTKPYQYLVHKYKKEGDSGYGQKISCSKNSGTCPLCDLGDKPKARWLFGVISRRANAYKVLDIGGAVFGHISKLAQNTARWGDPTKYDIDIVVNRNGGAAGYYTVQPIAKEPLSAADQVLRDSADLEELKKRVTPPDAEYVQRRMDKINGVVTPSSAQDVKVASKPVVKPVVRAPVVSQPPVQSVDPDEDDLDTSFPNYEA